jgi:hypothetical protein
VREDPDAMISAVSSSAIVGGSVDVDSLREDRCTDVFSIQPLHHDTANDIQAVASSKQKLFNLYQNR